MKKSQLNRTIFYRISGNGNTIAKGVIQVSSDPHQKPSLNSNIITLSRTDYATILKYWRLNDPASRTIPEHARVEALILFTLRKALY